MSEENTAPFWDMKGDWMRDEFGRLEFVRSEKYTSFRIALSLFHQRQGKVIVETGTMRMHDDPGGASTLLFGAYCKRYSEAGNPFPHLYTVDNDAAHMEISRAETAKYKDCITYELMDSVEWFRVHKRQEGPTIDLLYLDSMDCNPEGDSRLAQVHQLMEYEHAKHALGDGSILLLDDNNFPSGGKTKFLKRLLPMDGWECIWDGGQSLWQKAR